MKLSGPILGQAQIVIAARTIGHLIKAIVRYSEYRVMIKDEYLEGLDREYESREATYG